MNPQPNIGLRHFCALHPNSKDYLTRICLKPSCSDNAFLCFQCVNQSHQSHKTISLNQLVEQIESCRYDSSLLELKEKLYDRLNVKGLYLQQIYEFRLEFNRAIDSFQQEFERFLELQDSKLRLPEQVTPFEMPRDLQNLQAKIGEQIRLYQKHLEEREKFMGNLENVEKDIQVQKNRIERVFSIGKTFLQELNWVDQIMNRTAIRQNPQVNYRWSSQLHHHDIEIRLNKVIRAESTVLEWVSALLDQRFEEKLTNYQWTLNMENKSGLVFVGICLESNPIKYRFMDNSWASAGHGHYALSSSGRVYSHSNNQVNGSQKGFTFGQNDQITFKLNLKEQKFSAEIKGTPKRFEFSIANPPSNDFYRAFVYLRSVGDIVSIESP